MERGRISLPKRVKTTGAIGLCSSHWLALVRHHRPLSTAPTLRPDREQLSRETKMKTNMTKVLTTHM